MEEQYLHISEGIPVHIETDTTCIKGYLAVPEEARGVVLFAHGGCSGRHSPCNRFVAYALHERKIATLLMDLLTEDEGQQEALTEELRFNISFLAERLLLATDWIQSHPLTRALPLGYYGADTGAAAALMAAAERPDAIHAVVSCGGRLDLALDVLVDVQAPTLLLVGGEDPAVIALNRLAMERMTVKAKRLGIIPRATHFFEEPGTLEEATRLTEAWFERYLSPEQRP